MNDVVEGRGMGDHPRSRGEYRDQQATFYYSLGSSPLSRGILIAGTSPWAACRIIPALAGNTIPTWDRAGKGKDHPRSRGEYTMSQEAPTICSGSSPLSRGIPAADFRGAVGKRIIPALAGNTRCFGTGADAEADHPRSRGEYLRSGTRLTASQGSSPLSRGIRYPRTGVTRG